MSTQNYYTIRQRNPLRVPSSFNDQERSLVIQLEGIFDDIYKKFGRLGMDDMSGEFKFVINNKYDKISGITITDEGVDISGSKYVHIKSGDDEWTFDSNGLQYQDDNSPLPFEIRNYDERSYLASGIFTKYDTGLGKIIVLTECANNYHTSASGYWRGEIHFEMTDQQDTTDERGNTISGLRYLIYPSSLGDLGKPGYPWQRIMARYYQGYNNGTNILLNICPNPEKPYTGVTFTESVEDGLETIRLTSLTSIDQFIIQAKKVNATNILASRIDATESHGYFYGTLISNNGSLFLYPNGISDKYIKFEKYTYNSTDYTKIWSNASLIFEGNLTGNVTGNVTGNLTGNVTGNVTGDVTGDLNGNVLKKTTTATSFNNITDPGTYAFAALSSMSDKPSNISAGSAILEVDKISTKIYQRMNFEESIYVRQYYNGTWSSWSRLRGFTGAPTYGQLSGRA